MVKLNYNTHSQERFFFFSRQSGSLSGIIFQHIKRWLQLKSHSWLAIKWCAAAMMIMPSNAACQREEMRAPFRHQRRQLQQFTTGRNTKLHASLSASGKFLISLHSLRWLLGLWQNILVHHASQVPDMIPKTALLNESFMI